VLECVLAEIRRSLAIEAITDEPTTRALKPATIRPHLNAEHELCH
jgi:hypothetical protein